MMIETKALAKNYGDIEAVKGVSFDVGRGELFGFLGPNGAGKTTTIHMLCTLISPTSGSAAVNGFDVMANRREVRRSVGLVMQGSAFDYSLTPSQTLLLHGLAFGLSWREIKGRTKELLQRADLWERRHHKMMTLSGGLQRRVEMMRGLLHRPDVLFLDEPTLGLDPASRKSIWDEIEELRADGDITIFLTTHYMEEAEPCDRIAFIDGGEIVTLDTPRALKRSVSGSIVTIGTRDNRAAAAELRDRYKFDPSTDDQQLSFVLDESRVSLPELLRTFPIPIDEINVRQPTLDDVFLKLTRGRQQDA